MKDPILTNRQRVLRMVHEAGGPLTLTRICEYLYDIPQAELLSLLDALVADAELTVETLPGHRRIYTAIGVAPDAPPATVEPTPARHQQALRRSTYRPLPAPGRPVRSIEILRLLAANGPMTSADITETLCVERRRLSSTLIAMANSGRITRTPHPEKANGPGTYAITQDGRQIAEAGTVKIRTQPTVPAFVDPAHAWRRKTAEDRRRVEAHASLQRAEQRLHTPPPAPQPQATHSALLQKLDDLRQRVQRSQDSVQQTLNTLRTARQRLGPELADVGQLLDQVEQDIQRMTEAA